MRRQRRSRLYGGCNKRALPPRTTTVLTSATLLIAGGSSEAVLGPRTDHATPGPSALVLRHACVGVTGGRVPLHRRKVAAAPGPGWGNLSGTTVSDGRMDGRRADALPPPRIAGSSRHRMRKSKWPAEGHSERLQRCAAADTRHRPVGAHEPLSLGRYRFRARRAHTRRQAADR